MKKDREEAGEKQNKTRSPFFVFSFDLDGRQAGRQAVD